METSHDVQAGVQPITGAFESSRRPVDYSTVPYAGSRLLKVRIDSIYEGLQVPHLIHLNGAKRYREKDKHREFTHYQDHEQLVRQKIMRIQGGYSYSSTKGYLPFAKVGRRTVQFNTHQEHILSGLLKEAEDRRAFAELEWYVEVVDYTKNSITVKMVEFDRVKEELEASFTSEKKRRVALVARNMDMLSHIVVKAPLAVILNDPTVSVGVGKKARNRNIVDIPVRLNEERTTMLKTLSDQGLAKDYDTINLQFVENGEGLVAVPSHAVGSKYNKRCTFLQVGEYMQSQGYTALTDDEIMSTVIDEEEGQSSINAYYVEQAKSCMNHPEQLLGLVSILLERDPEALIHLMRMTPHIYLSSMVLGLSKSVRSVHDTNLQARALLSLESHWASLEKQEVTIWKIILSSEGMATSLRNHPHMVAAVADHDLEALGHARIMTYLSSEERSKVVEKFLSMSREQALKMVPFINALRREEGEYLLSGLLRQYLEGTIFDREFMMLQSVINASQYKFARIYIALFCGVPYGTMRDQIRSEYRKDCDQKKALRPTMMAPRGYVYSRPSYFKRAEQSELAAFPTHDAHSIAFAIERQLHHGLNTVERMREQNELAMQNIEMAVMKEVIAEGRYSITLELVALLANGRPDGVVERAPKKRISGRYNDRVSDEDQENHLNIARLFGFSSTDSIQKGYFTELFGTLPFHLPSHAKQEGAHHNHLVDSIVSQYLRSQRKIQAYEQTQQKFVEHTREQLSKQVMLSEPLRRLAEQVKEANPHETLAQWYFKLSATMRSFPHDKEVLLIKRELTKLMKELHYGVPLRDIPMEDAAPYLLHHFRSRGILSFADMLQAAGYESYYEVIPPMQTGKRPISQHDPTRPLLEHQVHESRKKTTPKRLWKGRNTSTPEGFIQHIQQLFNTRS